MGARGCAIRVDKRALIRRRGVGVTCVIAVAASCGTRERER